MTDLPLYLILALSDRYCNRYCDRYCDRHFLPVLPVFHVEHQLNYRQTELNTSNEKKTRMMRLNGLK